MTNHSGHSRKLFRKILPHELVHFVQRYSGQRDERDCRPAKGETEACRPGGRCLRETRRPDPLPDRNFWSAIRALLKRRAGTAPPPAFRLFKSPPEPARPSPDINPESRP